MGSTDTHGPSWTKVHIPVIQFANHITVVHPILTADPAKTRRAHPLWRWVDVSSICSLDEGRWHHPSRYLFHDVCCISKWRTPKHIESNRLRIRMYDICRWLQTRKTWLALGMVNPGCSTKKVYKSHPVVHQWTYLYKQYWLNTDMYIYIYIIYTATQQHTNMRICIVCI